MTRETLFLDETFFQSMLELKEGNREFVLSGSGDQWYAAIGNKSEHVSIGEAVTYGDDNVEFLVGGKSPLEVLINLRYQLKTARSE